MEVEDHKGICNRETGDALKPSNKWIAENLAYKAGSLADLAHSCPSIILLKLSFCKDFFAIIIGLSVLLQIPF